MVVVFVVEVFAVEVVPEVPLVPVVPPVDIAPPVLDVSVDIAPVPVVPVVLIVLVIVVPVVSVDIVPVVPVIEVSVDMVELTVDELSVATAPVSVTLLLFVSLLQAKPKTVRARILTRIRVFFICFSSQTVTCDGCDMRDSMSFWECPPHLLRIVEMVKIS